MTPSFGAAITLSLPEWTMPSLDLDTVYPSEEDKVRLAIRLAALNVEHGTGGPFGAVIFSHATHQVVSVGVNRVVHEQCSVAHAEMMAFMLAHTHNHASPAPLAPYVLAVSAQPCSMCFGALPWTEVTALLYGATREDIESITDFDEGPLHPAWKEELVQRGISVKGGLLRDEARTVLQAYSDSGGANY